MPNVASGWAGCNSNKNRMLGSGRKGAPNVPCGGSASILLNLGHAAADNPFGHVNIAIGSEACTVGAAELTDLDMLGAGNVRPAFRFDGWPPTAFRLTGTNAIGETEFGQDLERVFVKDLDPTEQLRNKKVIPKVVKATGAVTRGGTAQILPFAVIDDDSRIGPVGDV